MQNDLVPAFMKVAFIREFGAKERRSAPPIASPAWAHRRGFTMGLSPQGRSFGRACDVSPRVRAAFVTCTHTRRTTHNAQPPQKLERAPVCRFWMESCKEHIAKNVFGSQPAETQVTAETIRIGKGVSLMNDGKARRTGSVIFQNHLVCAEGVVKKKADLKLSDVQMLPLIEFSLFGDFEELIKRAKFLIVKEDIVRRAQAFCKRMHRSLPQELLWG